MATRQDWLLARCASEASSSSAQLAELVAVQSVVSDCVDDVVEAFRVNELASARREVAAVRLEAEVACGERDALVAAARRRARAVAGDAFEARACLRGVLDDVAKCRLVAKVAEAERLKLRRAEGEARKVPALEREVARLGREAEATRRRDRARATTTAGGGEGSDLKVADAPATAKTPKASLTTLEDKLVLKVFSFLTAWGVLASAQSDVPFFRRVDKLFGMGSAVAARLREKDAAAATAGHRRRGAPSTSANGRSPPPSGSASLSAETAAAIASKLNAAEIKGIIALDQRAKRLDGECALLKAEKDDLKAALEGTEGVKDFLAAKLRDAEETLKAALEADEATRSQRRSDQEVINFLDAKVRDLEVECGDLRARRENVEADLRRDRDAALKQLAHLETCKAAADADRDARDSQAKEQKKLLVKEVKALRAQLAAVHRAAARRV